MAKTTHEIRDPIHIFIRMDDIERTVVDSEPVQRLRQIHQLATTYLVYPGATHRRFEHSLGVMELASRVFDVVTNPDNIHPSIKGLFPDLARNDSRAYWRRVIRMAALCHDLGHLPFSHAAEAELLPSGWTHEQLTVALVRDPRMVKIWDGMKPPLKSDDIAKLAVGQKDLPNEKFDDLEAILSEIIVGDAFGVDRMDYLLRDSLHTGVAYGRFDHFRLIDTLRILPPPADHAQYQQASIAHRGEKMGAEDVDNRLSREPQLGVEEGGLQSAEALLLARYFMFSQVYFHPIRRIYDIHLKDFLKQWLPKGKYPTRLDQHLHLTDAEVIAAMSNAARSPRSAGHEPARRIVQRRHFKLLWEQNPADLSVNPEAGSVICEAVEAVFGTEAVRRDRVSKSGATIDFPVAYPDNRVTSGQLLSEVLRNLPTLAFDYVFVQPELISEAKQWLDNNREAILKRVPREE